MLLTDDGLDSPHCDVEDDVASAASSTVGADSERNGGSSDVGERLSTAGSDSVAGSDVSAEADHEEVVCLVLVASVLQSGGFYLLCVYCGFVWICDLMVLLTDCTE